MSRAPFVGLAHLVAFATSCGGAVQPGLTARGPAASSPIVAAAAGESAPPPSALPAPPPAPPAPAPPPTWSSLFSAYMAPGTEGGCGRASRCHAEQMGDAASAYAWLRERGYIAGAQSAIASTNNSCLRWFGGNMPPGGQPNPKAAADLAGWVAGGAPED